MEGEALEGAEVHGIFLNILLASKRMGTHLPDELPAGIRTAAHAIIEAARREGWTVRVNLIGALIYVSATSPLGSHPTLVCGQEVFVERLQGLLSIRNAAE